MGDGRETEGIKGGSGAGTLLLLDWSSLTEGRACRTAGEVRNRCGVTVEGWGRC
jgi:hypothetical protein